MESMLLPLQLNDNEDCLKLKLKYVQKLLRISFGKGNKLFYKLCFSSLIKKPLSSIMIFAALKIAINLPLYIITIRSLIGILSSHSVEI